MKKTMVLVSTMARLVPSSLATSSSFPGLISTIMSVDFCFFLRKPINVYFITTAYQVSGTSHDYCLGKGLDGTPPAVLLLSANSTTGSVLLGPAPLILDLFDEKDNGFGVDNGDVSSISKVRPHPLFQV